MLTVAQTFVENDMMKSVNKTTTGLRQWALVLPILALFSLATASCSKDKNASAGPTIAEKLVATDWVLETAGFDDDSTGFIEPNENQLTECQSDNSIRFLANGTGFTYENDNQCVNVPAETGFEWSLDSSQTRIWLGNTPMEIRLISANELVLAYQEYLLVPFLATYKAQPK